MPPLLLKRVAMIATALAVVPGAAAQGEPPISVELVTGPPGKCALEEFDPCPIGYDAGERQGAGDDTLYLYQDVREIRAHVEVPLMELDRVTMDFGNISAHHGLGPHLESVSRSIHSAAPEEVSGRTGFWVDDEGLVLRRPYDNEMKLNPVDKRTPWPFGVTYSGIRSPHQTPYPDVDYWLVNHHCPDLDQAAMQHVCGASGYDLLLEEVPETLPRFVVGARLGSFAVEMERDSNQSQATAPTPTSNLLLPGVPADRTMTPATGQLLEQATPSLASNDPPPGSVEVPRDLTSASQAMKLRTATAPPPEATWLIARTAAATGAALVGLAALYHRLRRETLLLNPRRAAIFQAIRADPGIRVGTLARQLNLDATTVDHHVDLLRKFRLVDALEGGQRRLFVAGAQPPEEIRRNVATSAPSARLILEHVRHGEREFRELRLTLGMKSSTASEAVDRLAEAGLVVRRRWGGRVWVCAVERA